MRRGRRSRVTVTEEDVEALSDTARAYVTALLIAGFLVTASLFVIMLSSFYALIASYNVIVWSSIHIFFTLIAWFATRGYGCSVDITCSMGAYKIVAFLFATGFLVAIGLLYIILTAVDLITNGCAGIPACTGATWQFVVVHILVIFIVVVEIVSIIIAWLLNRNISETCVKDLCLIGKDMTKSEIKDELINRGIDKHDYNYMLLQIGSNNEETEDYKSSNSNNGSKKKRKLVKNSYAGGSVEHYEQV